MNFWFTSEEGTVKSAAEDTKASLSSQSASAARELTITLGTTIAVTAVRVYFTLVMVSFTKAMLKQKAMDDRYNENQSGRSLENIEEEEIMNETGLIGEFRKAVFDLETRAKEYLNDLFK
ncbi:hypothetical protein G210_5413 [Candida maltosa Xu316]|uniref:Uncharacterized protein n=1 Tax=Candida maltosa (strain Xu316) TaxID=1245528 RepID=M3K3B6_CANMX|nr:hypothetical protein G210_5413 [Candida maltosa Xu316]